MEKRKIAGIILISMFLCTACSSQEETHDTLDNIRKEIDRDFKEAADGKYSNLTFECDHVNFPEGNFLQTIHLEYDISSEDFEIKMSETLDAFARLMDVDEIDMQYVYDNDTCYYPEDREYTPNDKLFQKNYLDIINSLDEYESCPNLIYFDGQNSFQQIYFTGNGTNVYLSQGKLGSYVESASMFVAQDNLEFVKRYDCNNDDLSDSYILLDGEITVEEGKEQIEEYYDSHYPLSGTDNGLRNTVYAIDVLKIPDKEIYVFNAYRTFSYQGIPIRGIYNGASINEAEGECGVMAEGLMVESEKVDITLGMINTFDSVEVTGEISEIIPFNDVLSKISTYLTGRTDFVVSQVGIEYRMFVDENNGYNLTPYWVFSLTNERDQSNLKIYVDVQTGKTSSVTMTQ